MNIPSNKAITAIAGCSAITAAIICVQAAYPLWFLILIAILVDQIDG